MVLPVYFNKPWPDVIMYRMFICKGYTIIDFWENIQNEFFRQNVGIVYRHGSYDRGFPLDQLRTVQDQGNHKVRLIDYCLHSADYRIHLCTCGYIVSRTSMGAYECQ